MNSSKSYLLITIFLIVASSFNSCTKYIQIYDVDSSKIPFDKDSYIYENDTIKVVYYFWKRRGMMGFAIKNKLSKPILIDWKKSTFSFNGKIHPYWQDKSQVTTRSRTSYSFFAGNFLFGTGSGVSMSVVQREEQETFIPPSGWIERTDFELISESSDSLRSTAISFDESNTPFRWRNFITVKVSGDMVNENYVDNSFYVNKIESFKYRDFLNNKIDTTEILANKSAKFYSEQSGSLRPFKTRYRRNSIVAHASVGSLGSEFGLGHHWLMAKGYLELGLEYRLNINESGRILHSNNTFINTGFDSNPDIGHGFNLSVIGYPNGKRRVRFGLGGGFLFRYFDKAYALAPIGELGVYLAGDKFNFVPLVNFGAAYIKEHSDGWMPYASLGFRMKIMAGKRISKDI
jgi:hypothetical protein